MGHEGRAGVKGLHDHALEAACCMGETWAMRAELESRARFTHGMH